MVISMNKMKYSIKNFDFRLVIMLLMLSIFGVIIIGSAKESVQGKQIIGLIIGFVLMLILSFVDYHIILKIHWPIYFVNIALLLLVMFIGDSSNNAQRWVEIAGIRFQPSETSKILLILFYAKFIMKMKDKMKSPLVLLMAVLLFLPSWFLVYKQPDLSTSIILIILFAVMMYVGELGYKIVLAIIGLLIPAVLILVFLIMQPDQQIIDKYQKNRILAWIEPEKYELDLAYQTRNSIMAIGSGQLNGKGLDNNEVGSVKNGNYISEPQTDFIFAIVGEELGFVGCSFVIIMEMLIAGVCFHIAYYAPDIGGRVIAAAMGGLVCFQSFVNISVTTGIMPNTGLPLPFVSYGLTSLVSLFIGMGFVLNVGLQRKRSSNIAKFDPVKDLDFDFDN